MIFLLKRLWKHIGRNRKIQFILLLILTIFTSFAEILSLGALLPFLTALSDPDLLFDNSNMRPLWQYLKINTSQSLLFPLAIIFSGAAVLAGGMRLLQGWANVKFSFSTGADLSITVYRKTLYQPYSVHVGRNSSAIINAASVKTEGVIGGSIIPVVTIITSGVILVSIMSSLIFIDAVVAISSFIGFGVVYSFIIFFTKRRLATNGLLIARESDQVIKCLQEGLGGIRDVLIDGAQEIYCDLYRRSIVPQKNAQANNQFISQSPRFVIEAIGMVLIATLAIWLIRQPEGISKVIPILGTLAFGAQRMLPALQQVYAGWSSLQSGAASLRDVLELLEQPMSKDINTNQRKVGFTNSLELREVSFKYQGDKAPYVLKGINISIKKGSKVGIVGPTGSGKSTLLDIIMGLLSPTKGSLFLDGVRISESNLRGWQKNIAHVPQSIFLADISIEENIAFGVPKENINSSRVRVAAKKAQISTFIESLPNQYNSYVGERGVRLSGGQRQRIGIARALYKKSDIIVFDEATSSLDNQTEIAVMEAIDSLEKNLTSIIIAHRISTLKNCDVIFELRNGTIHSIGTYKDFAISR